MNNIAGASNSEGENPMSKKKSANAPSVRACADDGEPHVNKKTHCEKCGDCCMHMGHPPFLAIGKERGGRTVDGWLIDFDHSPEMPEKLIKQIRDYIVSLSRGGEDRGAAELPCFWLDLKTKRCKHYEFRPEVCRDYFCGYSHEELMRRIMPQEPEKIVKDIGCYVPLFQKQIVKIVLERMTRRDQRNILNWLNRRLGQPRNVVGEVGAPSSTFLAVGGLCGAAHNLADRSQRAFVSPCLL